MQRNLLRQYYNQFQIILSFPIQSRSMSTLRKHQSSQFQSSRKNDYKIRRSGLTQDQLQQISQAFQLFDPHGTGNITYHELKVIMRALGFDIKKSEVVALAREFDIDESGKIQFQDYSEIMSRKYAERDPIQETLKAFRLFDSDGKGKISLNDLRKVAKQLGQTLREQELIAMIEQFDRDGDGLIDQEEFLAIIKPSLI